jgi:hypothetical protein
VQRQHSRRKFIGAGLVGLGALTYAACSGGDGDREGEETATATLEPAEDSGDGPTPTPVRSTATRSPTRTPVPTPPPTATPIPDSPPMSFRMPIFGVEAPIIELGLIQLAGGGTQMDTPADPVSVGWYGFTQKVGRGNSVFSAHVDWYTGQPASFGRIFELEKDNEIAVLLQDGTEVIYRVERKQRFHVSEVPVGELIAETPDIRATLITCGGTFDPSSDNYDHRDVVWAVFNRTARPYG